MLQIALFEAGPSGELRLLGRVNAPELVEPVRSYLIDQQVRALYALGFARDDDSDGQDDPDGRVA